MTERIRPSEPGDSKGPVVANPVLFNSRFLLLKIVFLVVLALSGALLARIPVVKEWMTPASLAAAWLRDLGWPALPCYTLGSALLIAIGVPRLFFCPLAGAAFGFWEGLITTTTATMLAYWATFTFMRGRMSEGAEIPETGQALSFLRHDPGMSGVILARLIPVPGLITTVALSLSPVGRSTFLIGSVIGLVPEAVPLILFGAGVFEGNPRQLAWMTVGILAFVLMTWMLIRRLLARHPVAETGKV